MAIYGTVPALRARINKTSNADDDTLTALLTAASNTIDRVTNHEIPGVNVFAPEITPTARVYVGSGTRYQWIDEAVSITQVAVKDSMNATTYTAWAATDWLAFTGAIRHPNFNDLPYTAIMTTVDGDYGVFTSGFLGRHGDDFAGLSYSSNQSPYTGDLTQLAGAAPTVQVTARWGVTLTPPQEIAEACYMLAARWWKRMESAMSDTLASGELGQLLYTQPVDPDVKFLLMNTRWYRPQIARRL